jgi:hypothetical protein
MNVKNIKGRTAFNSGKFLGYVLWKHSDGFHLRWTTKGSKTHNFQGKIICEEKVMITKRVRSETEIDTREKNTIGWDTTLQGQVDGFDFRTPGNFTVDLKIKKKKIKTKNIFLGPNLTQPENNPFTIIQKIAERKLEVDTKKVKKEIKELKPEPVYEPIPKPELEPVYEPTPKPEPEPVYEPTPEPEPVYEPTPEPKLEPEPETRITAWLNQLQTYRKYEPAPEPVYEPEKTEENEEETSENESIEE